MRVAPPIRVATLAAAAAAALVLAAVPASAAVTPGWRVVKTLPPAESVWSGLFAVSGAGNAWSTWAACGPCGSHPLNHFYVEHSAGGVWRQVRVPSRLVKAARQSVALGTSSARNTWLIGAQGKVLRWNGSRWRAWTVPSWVVHSNLSGTASVVPAVFSRTSAWVFSLGIDKFANPDHYAARYNGRRWVKVTLPAVPSGVSALSREDIWVLGVTPSTVSHRNPASVLIHWNGKRWRTVTVPKARIPAGAVEFVRNVVAAGPRDVWLQREIVWGTSGAHRLSLLHWNGKAWRRVRLGFPTSSVSYLAQDGHGGVWMVANGPKPGYRSWFYHLNAGHWSRRAVPAARGTSLLDLTGLSWIPGTRSLWATGNMSVRNSSGILGAILKRGR